MRLRVTNEAVKAGASSATRHKMALLKHGGNMAAA